MPELKDAFRLATDHARPAPGALERQRALQRRAATRRKAGVFIAVAAVIALILATVLGGGALRSDGDRIADQPVPSGLYSLDVTTGALTPFHDPGPGTWSFQLAPDRSSMLMQRDRHTGSEVWISEADGTDPRRLIGGADPAETPAWFPDGRRIAYVGFGPGAGRQVFIYDMDTGQRTMITHEDPIVDAEFPSVSADGDTVYYATTRPGRSPRGEYENNLTPPPVGLIRAVDLATGSIRTISTNEDGGSYWPVEGDAGVAYVHRSGVAGDEAMEIHLIQPDGADVPVVERSSSIRGADFITWSPDGSLLAYGASDYDGVWNAWVYDPSTEQHRMVGPGTPQVWLDDDTLLVGI